MFVLGITGLGNPSPRDRLPSRDRYGTPERPAAHEVVLNAGPLLAALHRPLPSMDAPVLRFRGTFEARWDLPSRNLGHGLSSFLADRLR